MTKEGEKSNIEVKDRNGRILEIGMIVTMEGPFNKGLKPGDGNYTVFRGVIVSLEPGFVNVEVREFISKGSTVELEVGETIFGNPSQLF